MNLLRLSFVIALLGCTSASPDPPCPAGQVLGYYGGCDAPAVCVPNTSGDAVAIRFCGCDGVTHTTAQWPPTQRWSSPLSCEAVDAGDAASDTPRDTSSDTATDTATDVTTDAATDVATDAATDVVSDAPTDVARDTVSDVVSDAQSDVASDVAACPLPPIDTASCASDSDCTTVARGCYCGQQPVNGVSRTYAAAVARCEDEARMHCALGCPIALGQVAQDGRSVTDGGTIAVRCVHSDASSVGACTSYVP